MKQHIKDYCTTEEWLSRDESERVELYEGTLHMMAPPNQRHQSVLTELLAQLHSFLKGKLCKMFPVPFGVKLFGDEDTVFEPDISVICDKRKLGGKTCNGAPDMVTQILSPSTARMDLLQKYKKYQTAGVREYWIVDPDKNIVINLADVFSEG